MHRHAGLLGAALGVWLSTASAWAQPQPGGSDPQRWIQTRHGAVQTILRTVPAGPPRDAQIGRIFNGMLDLDDLAQHALAPNWSQRTEAERREFIDLLRQLIENNYQHNLDETLEYQVTYSPAQLGADGMTATVSTVARSRTNPRATPVTVEYHLHRRGADWLVQDLVTNGSSLVQSYHDSYSRIIRDRGFPELLNRMRTRIGTLHAPTAPVAPPPAVPAAPTPGAPAVRR